MKKAIEAVRSFFSHAGSFENRHEVTLGLVAILFLGALLYGPTALNHFSTAKAAGSSSELSGWAWSENVGWISFNCSDDPNCSPSTQNYAVSEDTSTGVLSGYAWSSNIGWVSFMSQDVAGCLSRDAGSCTPTVNESTGAITGWARACGSFDDKTKCNTGGNTQNAAGGWQGWISLSCANKSGECATSSYGVEQSPSTGAWTQYAWGGGPTLENSVIGWIQFDLSRTPADVPTPPGCSNLADCSVGLPSSQTSSLQLYANGGTRVSLPSGGGSVVFTWTSTNVSRCDDIKNVDASITVSTNGQSNSSVQGVTQPVNQTNEFTLTCYDSSGSPVTSSPVVIDVAAPPAPPSSSCTPSLNATPGQVQKGDSSQLDWNAGDCGSNACTEIQGSDGNNYNVSGSSGTVTTDPLTNSTNYTLECENGSAKTSVRVQTEIEI